MITVHKGNAENAEAVRLILRCDQCQARVNADVLLDDIRDQGHTATELCLERARGQLAQVCPHLEEELRQQSSSQEERNTPSRRPSSYIDHS